MKFECATPTHNWLTEKPSSTRPMKNENIRKKLFSLLRNIDEFIKIDRTTRRILTHNRLLKKTITKETNSVSILSFIVTALSLPLSFGRLRLIFSYRIYSVSWMWMILWWQNVIHFYHDFKFWSYVKMTSSSTLRWRICFFRVHTFMTPKTSFGHIQNKLSALAVSENSIAVILNIDFSLASSSNFATDSA